MVMPRKPDPLKHCQACGAHLCRKRYRGTLESMHSFLRRQYCDARCMGSSRMVEDPTLRTLRSRTHRMKLRQRSCEICGTDEGQLDLHHVDLNPANNSPKNLMTLCARCHTKWHWEHGKNTTQHGLMGLPQDYLDIAGPPAPVKPSTRTKRPD